MGKKKFDLEDLVVRLASKSVPFKKALTKELVRVAIEFDTPEAMKSYLEKHPKANPKNHSVKKTRKTRGNLPPLFDKASDKLNKLIDRLEEFEDGGREITEEGAKEWGEELGYVERLLRESGNDEPDQGDHEHYKETQKLRDFVEQVKIDLKKPEYDKIRKSFMDGHYSGKNRKRRGPKDPKS